MLNVEQHEVASTSCPNLVDCVESVDGIAAMFQSKKCKPKTNAVAKPFLSNIMLQNRFQFNVDVIVSSAEAEDIAGSPTLHSDHSDMLPRYRQRSQSLDKLLSTDAAASLRDGSRVGKFRKETGEDCKDGDVCSFQRVFAVLENPESETRWYFKYFLGKVHKNYLGYDIEKTPFFLSVVNGGDNVYRCVLWKKTGNKRMCFQDTQNGKDTGAKAILKKFALPRPERSVKEVLSASLQEDFLTLEEQEGSVNFKFGVLYAKAGQQSDDEMFSNENGSQSFHQFLDLLGDTIQLEGWSNFKGGLDTRNNATGSTSVYTVFEGHEVMFHVSTMLPYSKENRQQVERKRHIGNDIVVIIFVDGTDEEAYSTALGFNPRHITSHFNHIFALVTYCKARDSYRLVMYSAESVPNFGPQLPPNGEFKNHMDFRDFIMAKLINAEKASYSIPTFSLKRERTLGLLLKDVEQKCVNESRKYLGQISASSPNAGRRYKELEQSFSEVGQKLKVQKITKGEHPTSHRTTAFKKDAWDTTCMVENFPYKVVCGDVCGSGELIVSSHSDGTYMIFSDGSHLLIIDKSLPVSQLVVAHRHKILLFRSGFPKDTSNYLYAIPLEMFFGGTVKVYNNSSLESYRLQATKGCHLFCTTPLSSNYLRVVAAIKSKVVMLVWKHIAAERSPVANNCGPITPCLDSSYNVVDGFVKHREFALADVPIMMDLMDITPSGKLCVVYQKNSSVEAVDEITGDSQKIYNIDSLKMKVKEMQVVVNNGKHELLLGHSLTCKTLSLLEGMVYSNSPEITWNAEPRNIAYLPPYILAFTTDTIEIRMISNGSLIQTIDVPDLKLISHKSDLIFSSRSLVINPVTMAASDSFARPAGKASKILGKSDQQNHIHIYKMRQESTLGRQSSGRSLQSLGKEEESSSSTSSSRCSVSDECQVAIDPDSTDVGTETRKATQMALTPNRDGLRSPSKPNRHMLVIPDLNIKERIMEVKCQNSSLSGNTTPALVSPSPDSGVHDDLYSPPSGIKNNTRIPLRNIDTSSAISNCDGHLKRSSLPFSSILGDKVK